MAAAEAALGSAISDEAKAQAEDAKAKALERIAQLQAQWAAAKAELQPVLDAVAPARAAAVAAEAVRVAAADAAQEARRELEPISMFISRQTQRLYVRRPFQPIWESPVTILDPDRPMGTHVFTAMERTNGGTDMRWSAVTVDNGRPRADVVEARGRPRGGRGQDIDPVLTDPDGAKSVLDRIVIPQDALDRIAGMVSPRSSLIVSDEALSPETGKDTEFVVILSGEPKGSMKPRRRGVRIQRSDFFSTPTYFPLLLQTRCAAVSLSVLTHRRHRSRWRQHHADGSELFVRITTLVMTHQLPH